MSDNLLNFSSGPDGFVDSPASQPELEPDNAPEIEPEPEVEPLAPVGLVELLPADFKLPLLTRFCPNVALRRAADQAAADALAVRVEGAVGLQKADVALTVLRINLRAIEDHLEEPIGIANALHKRLTAIRAEWQAQGKEALAVVGRAVLQEQRRLEAIAEDTRRKAQAEADRLAREAAAQEVKEAQKAHAPAEVVEALKADAKTATAPPVAAAEAPALRGSSTVDTWKARIVGTLGADPNPAMEDLTPLQRAQVLTALRAVAEGKAPLAIFELNWSYLNNRAKADKSAMEIPGFEAFKTGGLRAKSTRIKR